MAQDIRDLLKKDLTSQDVKMTEGHESRFLDKLEEEFPPKKSIVMFSFMKIAAVGIVLISIGVLWFNSSNQLDPASLTNDSKIENKLENQDQLTLGDISPEFEKIENYYLTGINMKLAGIKLTKENKEFLEGYMERLQVLDEEYASLNKELNTLGPNEQTITALIENLKLRLDLLIKLNNKLHQFKQSENEQINHQQA